MIAIAGGTYLERCLEPRWNYLLGSGTRAAAALSHLSDSVSFTTFVSDEQRSNLMTWSDLLRFSVQPISCSTTLTFSYEFSADEPISWPAVCELEADESPRVEADCVLRFGTLEGAIPVSGRRVVYDPQDPHSPRPFHENGSEADRLAIVGNRLEITNLLGGLPLSRVRDILIRGDGAQVVVAKLGPFGALIVTEDEETMVPAYMTDAVWPIGSGDVFSAVFAHFWAENELDPNAAAQHASIATAYYCATKRLPIPPLLPSEFLEAAPAAPIVPAIDQRKPRVYLAGPFFTIGQRWVVRKLKHTLVGLGIEVFSPLDDVGFGGAEEVATADLVGLDDCDAVFAIVDGLDAGTLFEVGYARARGIPVVALAQNVKEEDMTMLVGSHCAVFSDIATAAYHAAWRAASHVAGGDLP
jgi:nucleoside 2-deoxyribosyltransferase